MRHVNYALPSIADVIDRTMAEGQLTSPAIRCVGISVNTASIEEVEALRLLDRLAAKHGLPAVDPVRFGVAAIVEEVRRRFPT